MPDIWSRLSEQEQFRLALATAERRLSSLKRRYPGVVAAGAGYRLREKVRHPEICLHIVVAKKWRPRKRARDVTRTGELPACLRVGHAWKGKRGYIDIPIDVTEQPIGRPAATVDMTNGIGVVSADGNLLLSGSACCVVRDAARPNDRYLLSCNHVLTGGGASDDLEVDEHALTCDVDGSVIATLAQWAPLMIDNGFGTDAALAKIVDPDFKVMSVWDRSVTGIGSVLDLPRPLFLLVRRRRAVGRARGQGPLTAPFVSVLSNAPFVYGGRIVGIRRAIQYTADTEDGDCGSALISGDGLLYGMHFFEGDDGFSYAVSIEDLFADSPFGIDIRL